MKKRLIPFSAMPGSWGLSGKIYDEAEANYYYDGEELDKKLVEIEYKYNKNKLNKELALNALEYRNGKISLYEKELRELKIKDESTAVKIADLDYRHHKIEKADYEKIVIDHSELSDLEKKIEKLRVDFESKKIDKNTFEKETHTLQEKPWVGVKDNNLDINQGVNGFFIELDWNEYWIEFLRLNGYTGFTDEELVEAWFNDVTTGQFQDEDVSVIQIPSKFKNRI